MNIWAEESVAASTLTGQGTDMLYVTHRVPYPPDKGDRIRNYYLLQYLSQRASIHLATLADEPVSKEAFEALGRLCHRIEIVPQGRLERRVRAASSLLMGGTASEGAFSSSRLRSTLRSWAQNTRFQAVFASASSVADYLRLPELRGIPAIVDLVDVDSQKWLDYARTGRGLSRWIYATEGNRLRRLESALADWVHAVTLVSQNEVEIYRRFQPGASVHAIPNGVDLDYFSPMPAADDSGCVFVGALDYRPNVDGIVWFCNEVWPEVRLRRPDARLALVGRRPVAAIQRLNAIAGVTVVGQVPDVRPYLGSATIAVVPLQIARGVQNKILEALAMGKPVVASPEAVEGLGVTSGSQLMVAEHSLDWVELITRLLEDDGTRRTLALAGRQYVEQEHRWEQCLKPIEALFLEAWDSLSEGRSILNV